MYFEEEQRRRPRRELLTRAAHCCNFCQAAETAEQDLSEARALRLFDRLISSTNNASGTVRPIALAVFDHSSKLVACSIGISATLMPRKSSTICRK
jgi:hypothetical protein